MDSFGGFKLALALGQWGEELLEVSLQGLLLNLQFRLVLPASAVLPDGLLEFLQLPSSVTDLVLHHLMVFEQDVGFSQVFNILLSTL